jgi:hypothetical protein
MQVLRERGSIDPTHSLTSALDGMSGQCHSPAALYPQDRRLEDGPQSYSDTEARR